MAKGVGPKKGGTGPPADPTCKKLDQKNARARARIIRQLKKKKTKAAREARKKAEKTGMTVSSAESTVPGANGSFTASSSGVANVQIPNNTATDSTSAQSMGMNAKDRASKAKKHEDAKEAAGVLCDKRHVHPGGGKGAHAECKIVNKMTNKGGAMRGGKMVLSIDWRSRTYGESGMPCSSCFAMLCKAAQECDIKVFICDHQQQQQPMDQNCDEPGKYEDLCERVDGGPTPGR